MNERAIEKVLEFQTAQNRVWNWVHEADVPYHEQNTGGWDSELGELVDLLGTT
ncbi:MAG: hypothetical protein MUO50_18495 [Longimicrobiales bacterium]|nr:hypothetical protein [Longimicrobiales bacterium]